MKICPNCGKKVDDIAVFCDECGQSMKGQPSEDQDKQETAGETGIKDQPGKPRKRRIVGILILSVVLLTAAIAGGILYAGGSVDQSGFIGTYYPSSARRGDQEMSPDSVLGEGFSVVLLEGEEAIFNLPGSTTEGRWKVSRSGKFSFSGSSMSIEGTLKDRLLTLELNGIELFLTWTAKIEKRDTESETETETESQTEVVTETGSESETETAKQDGSELFEGDWYGLTLFTQCSGDYAENEGVKAETIARFVFDENGNCTPYLAMALGSSSKAMNFRNLTALWDPASITLSIGGNCLKGSIAEETQVDINELGALVIEVRVAESGSGATLKVYLRRLDDNWKADDTISPNADQLEYYKGMNLETIASLFGVDITEIPKKGYKAPDLTSDEDALTASYGGWDESYFGVGVASAVSMKKTQKWISEMSAEDRADLTYEEVCDKIGSKGRGGATAETDPAYFHAVWYTETNKGPMRMKFKPSSDGTLYYVDCELDDSIYEE